MFCGKNVDVSILNWLNAEYFTYFRLTKAFVFKCGYRASTTLLISTMTERNSPEEGNNVPLTDNSLIVDISDALSEKDKVKFTVHTRTTMKNFQKSEFLVVRQHEEFIWLHDRYEEEPKYAGYIIPPPPPRPNFDASREKLQRLGEGEGTMTKEEFTKMKQELEAEYLATFKKTVAMHEVFLTRLASHSVFREDRHLHVFLEYDQDLCARPKGKLQQLGGLIKSVGTTTDQYYLNATVRDVADFFEQQMNSLTEYHGQLKEATTRTDKMTEKHKELADSYIKISAGLLQLANSDDGHLDKFLAKVAETYEKARKIESRVASDQDLKLADTLRYYMRDSQAARALLVRRLKCLANYENANRMLEKARHKNKDIHAGPASEHSSTWHTSTTTETGATPAALDATRKIHLHYATYMLTELLKSQQGQLLQLFNCQQGQVFLRDCRDLSLAGNGTQNRVLPTVLAPINLSVRNTHEINRLPSNAFDVHPVDLIKCASPGLNLINPGVKPLSPGLTSTSPILKAASFGVTGCSQSMKPIMTSAANSSMQSPVSPSHLKPTSPGVVPETGSGVSPISLKGKHDSPNTISQIQQTVLTSMPAKSVSVSVIKTKEDLAEVKSETPIVSLPNVTVSPAPPNTSELIPTTLTPAQKKATYTHFVEVESKLEEMFAGIEDSSTDLLKSNPTTLTLDVSAKLEESLLKLDEPELEKEEPALVSHPSPSTLSPKREENVTTPATYEEVTSSTKGKQNQKSATPKKAKRSIGTVSKKDSDEWQDKPNVKRKKVKKTTAELKKTPTNSSKKPAQNQAQASRTKSATDSVKDVYAYDSGSNASSSRSRGPFILVRGPSDSPISVSVNNTSIGEEGSEKTPAKTKIYHDDWHKIRSKGLHCSTLSNKYDAQTRDMSWICVFCKRGPHASELSGPMTHGPTMGDLFGPYYITTQSPEFERQLIDPFDRQFKSKKVARALDEQQGNKADKKTKKKHADLIQNESDVYLGIYEVPTTSTSSTASTYEVWTHEDCIVWSQGTHLVGARIVGLEEAVWQASGVSCSHCKLRGATVCCLNRGCLQRAHVPCAKQFHWKMDEEGGLKVWCTQHST